MRHLMQTHMKYRMCRLVPTKPAMLRYGMPGIAEDFLIQLEIKVMREREQNYTFCVNLRVNLPLIRSDTGHHQLHALPHTAPGLWKIRMWRVQTTSANPQDCGSCRCIMMLLTFCILELSVLKHDTLRPLSPRCKPPPCASLWVWAALLCWAACSRPRCTSSSSSPRRTWSLTDSISTGSASVGPGPITLSVSNKSVTFL